MRVSTICGTQWDVACFWGQLWTFKNRIGQLEGFEIDVDRQLAHDMEVSPECKVYPLETILSGLDKGEIDVIAAGLAITPSRALRVEHSAPYMASGITLVTSKSLTTLVLAHLIHTATSVKTIAA